MATEKHSCLQCRNFAGKARDRLGILLSQGKGYCDHPDHVHGIWNVVQSVTKEKVCELFEPAPEKLIEQRLKALEILIKRKKGGRHV